MKEWTGVALQVIGVMAMLQFFGVLGLIQSWIQMFHVAT